MSYSENGNHSRIENCFKKIDLMKATFRFCSDSKGLAKSLGVHESAAKQVVALADQLREELSALEGSLR